MRRILWNCYKPPREIPLTSETGAERKERCLGSCRVQPRQRLRPPSHLRDLSKDCELLPLAQQDSPAPCKAESKTC